MDTPPIAFLGICERSAQIERGDPLALQHNLLGLETVIFSYLFPLNISEFNYVFSIYNPAVNQSFCIRVLSPTGEMVLKIDITFELAQQPKENLEPTKNVVFTRIEQGGWYTFIPKLNNISALANEPGRYRVVLTNDNGDIALGELLFQYVKVPPLTEANITAMRSNPLAVKKVAMGIQCTICNNEIKTYAGLTKDAKSNKDGVIWYADLSETFKCKCGRTEFNLQYVRENLHALLGTASSQKRLGISFTRLYEERALEKVWREFEALLKNKPEEEKIQKFIEANPILLQEFCPEKVFFKKPILSKFVTDIVIVNQKKELLLVELEKSDTRLLKKDGGVAAELQHAMDQVQMWLREISNHRLACLDCLELKPDDITKIRGVVIAGRDSTYPSKHLNVLKWTNFGDLSFYSYDDLQGSLATLIRSLKEL